MIYYNGSTTWTLQQKNLAASPYNIIYVKVLRYAGQMIMDLFICHAHILWEHTRDMKVVACIAACYRRKTGFGNFLVYEMSRMLGRRQRRGDRTGSNQSKLILCLCTQIIVQIWIALLRRTKPVLSNNCTLTSDYETAL